MCIETFEIIDPTSMSVSRSVPWPTQVKCDMNIKNWEYQLKKHGLIDKDGFLLRGFREGFHQGVPEHTI